MPSVLAKIRVLGKVIQMIEVKVVLHLNSERTLRNDNPNDIFYLIGESFHDDETITEHEMFADYGRMIIEMQMEVNSNTLESAVKIGLAAVNAAVESAIAQTPWVKAEVGSVAAGQLAAA